MSIALVVTAGFGNGTLSGTIPFIVTRGYTIGEEIPEVAISARFAIKMPPSDRDISMAFDDRLIRIPPNRRKVDIS